MCEETVCALVLTAADIRTWANHAVAALAEARDRIDSANVFPVADADTGTNMYLTVRDGARSIPVGELAADGALAGWARGALLGARGNSGTILSEYLRGMAQAAVGRSVLDARSLADCLDRGARAAVDAVAHPVDGTILSAAREAAAAAAAVAGGEGDLPAVVLAAGRAARWAVVRSPRELDVLARAGVVDAGAQGLVVLFEALARAIGEPSGQVPASAGGTAASGSATAASVAVSEPPSGSVEPLASQNAASGHAEHGEGEFEVMFAVRSTESNGAGLAEELRGCLDRIGTSVVVVGGRSESDGVWQAHVHADDVGAVLVAARAVVCPAGAQLRGVRVRRLPGDARPVVEPQTPGWVAATSAPGLMAEFARGGAVVILIDDDGPADATTETGLERALLDTQSRRPVVLGSDEATVAAAADRLRADGVVVEWVPAGSDAAMAAAVAMLITAAPRTAEEASAALHAGVRSVRSGRIADASEVGALFADVGEIAVVTVIHDCEVGAELLSGIGSAAARLAPAAEVVMIDSGRPGTGIEIGIEGAPNER